MGLHANIVSSAVSLALAAPCLVAQEAGVDPERAANLIILDETGARNLRIETVEVAERPFESTVFAVGRIEEIPARRSVLSSRIAGRAVEVNAFEGDTVDEGEVLVVVESRQPGDPPPQVPLRAPQRGLVIASHVRVGQPVEPEAELLDISDRSLMWAVAKIPENEAAALGVGVRARIRVPALGGEPLVAELVRYGIEADRRGGAVEGIFELENPDGRLQPGMRAEFSIITSERGDVLAVPREAVQGDPARRVVYIKDWEIPNAFLRSPVALGAQNDDYVEVLSGVFPGDEVVTRGSYSLGFAGAGSVSLKEALDVAHGHEHAEDGSELTPEVQAGRANGPDAHAHAGGESHPHDGPHDHDHGFMGSVLKFYAIGVTVLLLVAIQALWKKGNPSAG